MPLDHLHQAARDARSNEAPFDLSRRESTTDYAAAFAELRLAGDFRTGVATVGLFSAATFFGPRHSDLIRTSGFGFRHFL